MSILGFDLEWFNPISELTHKLNLKYFMDDKTIEILKDKSTFLKRIHYPELTLDQLFLGNTITIHNRLYTVKAYANKYTSEYMKTKEARFVTYLPLNELDRLPRLMELLAKYNMVLGRVYSYYPNQTLIEMVGVSGKNYDKFVEESMTYGGGFSLQSTTVDEIQEVINRSQVVDIVYPCTLALIKPHIVRSPGTLGRLLEAITTEENAAYQITGMMSIHLTIAMAEELFDAYRGIVSDYLAFIEKIVSGPLLALIISPSSTANNATYMDVVTNFREFAGPVNPQVAKVLRSQSLRARFGSSFLENALHVTDLPEDGEMEVRYLFETLANLK